MIQSSTVSGNISFGGGGGIATTGAGNATNMHSTITNNQSDLDINGVGTGGGIFQSTGTITLDHTIVAVNAERTGVRNDDISGTVTANFSLIRDTTGATYSGVGNVTARPNRRDGSWTAPLFG